VLTKVSGIACKSERKLAEMLAEVLAKVSELAISGLTKPNMMD
jgi:hypothetical protein